MIHVLRDSKVSPHGTKLGNLAASGEKLGVQNELVYCDADHRNKFCDPLCKKQPYYQGCKFSDFCLISENFTSKFLKMFFEISSL